MASEPESLVAKLTRRQLEEYVPQRHQYYAFADSEWRPISPDGQDTAPKNSVTARLTHLRVITWNIDFMAPFPQARMSSALSHLQNLVETTPKTSAVVIMLQEMVQEEEDLEHAQSANDLGQITSASWVREKFHVTDLNSNSWRCSYHGVTLVDRRLNITRVARLPFVSEYQREALLVDVELKRAGSPGDEKTDGQDSGKRQSSPAVLRLCNVHLDSMAGKPPMRPIQWKACAKYLQDKSDGVVAGILAGDCNANQKYDLALPQENGFKDAYLELGGDEDDPEGITWGPQSLRTLFSHKRMDKVCFRQDEADNGLALLRPSQLQRIGVGVRVEDEAVGKSLIEAEELDFVTDHYGVMVDFNIGAAWAFGSEA